MSAETLRRAAALMRSNTMNAGIPPWHVEGKRVVNRDLYAKAVDERTARHIASWHPAVTIAVADLLEQIAESDFQDLGFAETCTSVGSEALAVANAYLGAPR